MHSPTATEPSVQPLFMRDRPGSWLRNAAADVLGQCGQTELQRFELPDRQRPQAGAERLDRALARLPHDSLALRRQVQRAAALAAVFARRAHQAAGGEL